MAKTPDERREQNRIHAQEKRDADRETFRKYRRDHYAKNRDEIRAYQNQLRAKNPERVEQYNKTYREKHTDKQREYNKRYYWANKDAMQAKLKEWLANNPDYNHRRHARNPARQRALNAKRKGAEGHYKFADIRRLFMDQGGLCSCGDQLANFHIDHIIPIAKHGTNWPWNLQLLCAPCNLEKRDRMPEWEELFEIRPFMFMLLDFH